MNNNLPDTFDYTSAEAFLDQVKNGLPPLIICVACNGGIQGKEVSPVLPETVEEIADSVHAAYREGATMVHVHARDPNQLWRGATTPEQWWAVNKAIRSRCPDIIINNTTGGDLEMTMEQRLSCLEAKPEVASLNLTPEMSRFALKERVHPVPHPRPRRELDVCIPYTYGLVRQFAAAMQRHGVKPELETYHTGGVWVIRDLIEAGLVTAPYWIQTVMGAQTGSFATPGHVLGLLQDFPAGSQWLCSGIGPQQLPMTALATLMGGHVRVGLEDNIYYRRGEKAHSNAQMVARAVRIASELNRQIATPAQARRMLGLSPEPTRY